MKRSDVSFSETINEMRSVQRSSWSGPQREFYSFLERCYGAHVANQLVYGVTPVSTERIMNARFHQIPNALADTMSAYGPGSADEHLP